MESLIVFDKRLTEKIFVNPRNITEIEFPNRIRKYSRFSDISSNEINHLRFLMFKTSKLNTEWAEKILKFHEIKKASFLSKLKRSLINTSETEKMEGLVESYLLECTYYTKDYRFINIVLKSKKTNIRLIHKTDQSKYNEALRNYLINIL